MRTRGKKKESRGWGADKFLQGKSNIEINSSGFIETDVAKVLFYPEAGMANRVPGSWGGEVRDRLKSVILGNLTSFIDSKTHNFPLHFIISKL